VATNCWARCLGGCSTEQSREHYVSKSVFLTSQVQLHGLPWCRDAPKRIGLASATAKILCTTHNNALSDLDDAAGTWYATVRDALALQHRRRKEPPWVTPKVVRFRIDAGRLERWLLKTLINLTYESELRLGSSDAEAGVPPASLVATCFGLQPFTDHRGMYSAVNVGMTLTLEDRLQFFPLLREGNVVTGGCFDLHGFKLVLSCGSAMLAPLREHDGMPPDWREAELHWHSGGIKMMAGIWPSHSIDFDWASAVQSRASCCSVELTLKPQVP
jgi:hypothetical protein